MRRAVIAGGWRTPFVRAGTDLARADVLELATAATAETLARTETKPASVDEIIYGNVSRPVAYHNLAREIVLALDLPRSIYASSVGMACASACVAITDASDHIAVGNADAVLAGGVESLSNVPITYAPALARAVVRASQAKTLPQRVSSFAGVKLSDLAPVAPGIKETSTGLTMGESAERMAKTNGIPREGEDRWALRSHERAAKGWDDGRLAAEVVPIRRNGGALKEDTHIRRDSSMARLGALRPVFDRAHGSITAGNARPPTHGAAPTLPLPEDRARPEGRTRPGASPPDAHAARPPAGPPPLPPAHPHPTPP